MEQVTSSPWRKSTHSGTNGGQCIEVAADRHAVSVRDSADRNGLALSIAAISWAKFMSTFK